MRKTQIFLAAAFLTSLTLLAACGGNGGDTVGSAGGGGGGEGSAPQMISDVYAFINNLIANNSENSDPIDTNSLVLATDDTKEPTPF